MRRPDWRREGHDWPNRAASRFLSAGGIDWHVQVAGAGPALLLLHGTGAATHSWRDLTPLLAERFTVIAPDLPGHGFTGPIDSPTLPRMARAMGALLEEMDRRPALALGHSAGAAILVRMALDGLIAPQAIVSVNGALLPFSGPAAWLFPAMAKLVFLNPFTPRLFAFQARASDEVGRFLLRSTGSRIDARGVELYGRLFGCSGHIAGALAMMANWDLEALRRDLPTLKTPLVLVAGEADAAVPPTVARDVARLVPTSEVIGLPGLGHLAHEERPESIAEIVVRVAAERANV